MILSFIRRGFPVRNLCDRFFSWRYDLVIDIKRLRSPIVIERIPASFYGHGEWFSVAFLLRSPLGPFLGSRGRSPMFVDHKPIEFGGCCSYLSALSNPERLWISVECDFGSFDWLPKRVKEISTLPVSLLGKTLGENVEVWRIPVLGSSFGEWAIHPEWWQDDSLVDDSELGVYYVSSFGDRDWKVTHKDSGLAVSSGWGLSEAWAIAQAMADDEWISSSIRRLGIQGARTDEPFKSAVRRVVENALANLHGDGEV